MNDKQKDNKIKIKGLEKKKELKQINKNDVIKYSLASILILSSGGALVLGLNPFSLGFFAAFVIAGLNPLILAPIYIITATVPFFCFSSLIGSVSCAIIIILAKIIQKKQFFKDEFFLLIAPISALGFLALTPAYPVPLLLFFLLIPIITYVSKVFFAPLIKRGVRFKLLDTELICGGIILSIIAMSIARVSILYFPILPIIAAFFILISGKIYGPIGAMAISLCFGIGHAAFDFQIVWLSIYPIMGLLAAIFRPAPRIIGALSNIIGYTLIIYFFVIPATHAHLYILALLIGGLIYTFIPNRHLAALKNILCPDNTSSGARYNINLLREDAARSIFRTGEVFNEMSYYMANGQEFNFEAVQFVSRVQREVCKECNRKCNVSEENLQSLLSVCAKKGTATIIDAPSEMFDSCPHIASLLASCGQIAFEHKQQSLKKGHENFAKGIVSEQLNGMGEVLKMMANRLKSPVSFDFELEDKIKEAFDYRGIFCFDCVISGVIRGNTQNNEGIATGVSNITLVIAIEHYDREVVETIVKKVLKQSFIVRREERNSQGMVVFLEARPLFDVVFASSSLAKDDISGDTHTFLKVGASKFLMALCDGMGSGKNAERFASSTVSLIECFYKAGFDHGMVIRSVNRFLSLTGEENFASSDICVLDLESGVMDIFKISSPACYIKGAASVKAIEGNSLPLGMLDEIKPSISSAVLNSGDMVILVSDGISDCFDGDSLMAEISIASDVSPEALCKHILEAARRKIVKPKDDMSIVAFRLFENV
ncbi:MAG: SpoIIE family protein phosphatase [Firmicutes bacterium]|nr:SpoIIE family protein phosphatase [Bacillota bacterium]